MKRIKIYTCGAMNGIPYDDQIDWRKNFENYVKYYNNSGCELVFVHPPLLYNYEVKSHYSESEIKEYELAQVRDSDIIVVNLDHIEKSIGAHYELSYADAMNAFGNKHIYIIGIGNAENLHPWIQLSLLRTESDIQSAGDYILKYLCK